MPENYYAQRMTDYGEPADGGLIGRLMERFPEDDFCFMNTLDGVELALPMPCRCITEKNGMRKTA